MLKRRTVWPRDIRWLAGGIAIVVLALTVAWVLFVPTADWLARHDVGSAKGTLLQTARDAARDRLLTIAAGLFAVGALVYTARNFTLSREGQVTDRYTKAIEQLGSDKLDVRIGGIYALERVARDSAKDHHTVMEVLAAFVREHSREPWPLPADDEPGSDAAQRRTRPDVQAAVTVIGRRDARYDRQRVDLRRGFVIGPRLDLRGAYLIGADLSNATYFVFADFRRADLRGADFGGADLTGADFGGANLRGAELFANLRGANFGSTVDLHGAEVSRGADLTGADLTYADLSRGAYFTGADLTSAKWPADAPVPEGWKRDTSSGELERAENSGPTGTN